MAYNDMNGCGNKCEAYVDLPLHTTTCRHWTHAIFHLRHSTPCASDAMPLKELSKDGEVREERVAGGGASWRHLHSRCLLASALATLRDACHCSWNGEGKDKSCWGGGVGVGDWVEEGLVMIYTPCCCWVHMSYRVQRTKQRCIDLRWTIIIWVTKQLNILFPSTLW